MQEVLDGVVHWTARHPNIGILVSSYWLAAPRVLLDPLLPAEGIEWFDERPPQAILLTNRHHLRDSERLQARFGCSIHCNEAGLHEFAGGDATVEGFAIGEELPGGVVAKEMDAICPDDTALYLREHSALALADGVVRAPGQDDGPLGFVPDSLMDDPPGTRQGLLASCRRLLEEVEFDNLLLAHGGPVVGTGRQAMQELIDAGGRTAFEGL